MRRDLLFGVGLAIVLLLGIFATFGGAEESAGLLPFPTQSATITLSNSGFDISPSELNPGPVVFTIVNNSTSSRGIYVMGDDLVGDQLYRYSARVLPGASGTMNFWLYQGQQYTFHDFTARRLSSGDLADVNHFSSTMTIPTVLPLGSGPQYDWLAADVSITDTDVTVSQSTMDHGPIVFNVTNNTSIPRGVIIKGNDRTGDPIFRYSGLIGPGVTRTVNFWLYEGQTYTIRDYTKSDAMRGPAYLTRFSTKLMVNPGSPAP